MKKSIRVNENILQNLIKKSVNRILNEMENKYDVIYKRDCDMFSAELQKKFGIDPSTLKITKDQRDNDNGIMIFVPNVVWNKIEPLATKYHFYVKGQSGKKGTYLGYENSESENYNKMVSLGMINNQQKAENGMMNETTYSVDDTVTYGNKRPHTLPDPTPLSITMVKRPNPSDYRNFEMPKGIGNVEAFPNELYTMMYRSDKLGMIEAYFGEDNGAAIFSCRDKKELGHLFVAFEKGGYDPKMNGDWIQIDNWKDFVKK